MQVLAHASVLGLIRVGLTADRGLPIPRSVLSLSLSVLQHTHVSDRPTSPACTRDVKQERVWIIDLKEVVGHLVVSCLEIPPSCTLYHRMHFEHGIRQPHEELITQFLTHSCLLLQIFRQLPPHLAISVLGSSQTSLHKCIRGLPASLYPLAGEACYPDIMQSKRLSFNQQAAPWSTAEKGAVIKAAATFTCVERLELNFWWTGPFHGFIKHSVQHLVASLCMLRVHAASRQRLRCGGFHYRPGMQVAVALSATTLRVALLVLG